MTEGPYFVDKQMNRSDIREGRPGDPASRAEECQCVPAAEHSSDGPVIVFVAIVHTSPPRPHHKLPGVRRASWSQPSSH